MIYDLSKIYENMIKDNFIQIKQLYKMNNNFIFARNEHGDTLLHIAVCENNLYAVKELIRIGACPILRNDNGISPLCESARGDKFEILGYLVEIMGEFLKEWEQAEMLAYASSEGLAQNVRYLLSKGFDCNANYREEPMLLWAVQSGKLEIIKLLVDSGADTNAVNEDGHNALYIACAEGFLEIAEFLLNCNADLGANTCTALCIASCYNQIDIVKLLLEYNIDSEVADNEGMTAFLYAVKYGNMEIVELLLKYGANVLAMDSKGRGIRHYSKKKSLGKLGCILEEHGYFI